MGEIKEKLNGRKMHFLWYCRRTGAGSYRPGGWAVPGLAGYQPLGSEGHCLIIPRRHVPWWHDLTKKETDSLFRMAQEVAGKIMETFHPDFVCMYARGRRIPHTHIFLVPTYSGDPLDRFFNALEGFQEAPRSSVGSNDRTGCGRQRKVRKAGSSGRMGKIKG